MNYIEYLEESKISGWKLEPDHGDYVILQDAKHACELAIYGMAENMSKVAIEAGKEGYNKAIDDVIELLASKDVSLVLMSHLTKFKEEVNGLE